mmetsp:Transcript_10353/g.21564  ORF Transcript_10353/g.21564 Transcript_10353/m.21564 type:complete len:553 (+) Transcript_10353:2-1660(+)
MTVPRSRRLSPTRPLDGITKKNSNRKPGILPPTTKGEESVQSTLQSLKKDDTTKAEAHDLAAKDLMSTYVSPSELSFTGDTVIPVTSRLHIVTPKEDTPRGVWPIFRMMDEDGTFRDGSNDGYHNEDEILSNDSFVNTRLNGSKINGGANGNKHESILSGFRGFLREQYPNQASEIERNGLLSPSKSVFADTDSKNTLDRLLRHMLRLREMDSIFQDAQRQGRLSFYLTCRGEEAIHFGATSALENQDVILGQYREQGPLMWRGFTLQQFADQCFNNASDLGKGRQMPIHYGSRALNYHTISSPLGTQIPQAVGVALRLKMSAAAAANAGDGSDSQNKKGVAMCFFGEGSTSTTDFHSGLNFAATLKCPVIFFCRNNGYAISTSVKEQYASDGVVSKAPGYGMAGIRVDGNDVFAVHAAVREARAYALENNAPVLIEGMSYRQGHHSTSDDSSQYRSIDEVEHFAQKSDPLDRLEKFLKLHEYDDITDEKIQSIIQEEKGAVLDALRKAERKPKPPVEDLFTDVYKDMPPSLQSQWNSLSEHMAKYPDVYKL